jgi:hypothetical protein
MSLSELLVAELEILDIGVGELILTNSVIFLSSNSDFGIFLGMESCLAPKLVSEVKLLFYSGILSYKISWFSF